MARLKSLHAQVRGGKHTVGGDVQTGQYLCHLTLFEPPVSPFFVLQVKGALEGAYTQNQELNKQVRTRARRHAGVPWVLARPTRAAAHIDPNKAAQTRGAYA